MILDTAYAEAAEAVRAANDILITTHVNPDGDGIGAGLALWHALTSLGKRVRFIAPSAVASLYNFLPGFEQLTTITTEAAVAAELGAELMISCDCGDRERLGLVVKVPHGRLLNLDHHVTNTRFGQVNVVDEQAESTGVVVERLLSRLGVGLDRTLAECLYTTIVFDTGRFMHSNTTAHTLRWSARLLDTGIDASAINRRLTYTRSVQDLALQRLAIERLRLDDGPRIAGIVLTKEDILTVGKPEDWGDLVEIPRSLAGNEIAYLIREHSDGASAKVSLRSNPPVAVGPVAQAFGGGGHAQAAGCTIIGTIGDITATVVARLKALDG